MGVGLIGSCGHFPVTGTFLDTDRGTQQITPGSSFCPPEQNRLLAIDNCFFFLFLLFPDISNLKRAIYAVEWKRA